jgi:hypothetical protein
VERVHILFVICIYLRIPDRQYNNQKKYDVKTNNCSQNAPQETKDYAIRAPLQTGVSGTCSYFICYLYLSTYTDVQHDFRGS